MGDTGCTASASRSILFPIVAGIHRAPPPSPGTPFAWGRGLPRRSPPEVAQRVSTEEVIVADVLIPCDIHHLQQEVGAGGGLLKHPTQSTALVRKGQAPAQDTPPHPILPWIGSATTANMCVHRYTRQVLVLAQSLSHLSGCS